MGDREPPIDLLSKRLSKWETDLREAHSANVVEARNDPQKAGHRAERIWVRVAEQILPPSYRVQVRQYMDTEIDVVVLPPSAPAFYNEADVIDIPPDVASAVFHVKNTLNKGELRDAVQRVHVANQGQRHYRATLERERQGLPSAIVALGSDWAGGFDTARAAFLDILSKEFVPDHPSQIPGFIGTPDWDIYNLTVDLPASHVGRALGYPEADPRCRKDHVLKLIASKPSGFPIHSFAQWLYTACAASDPSLEPIRVALTQLFSLSGQSTPFPFEAASVYSDSRIGR